MFTRIVPSSSTRYHVATDIGWPLGITTAITAGVGARRRGGGAAGGGGRGVGGLRGGGGGGPARRSIGWPRCQSPVPLLWTATRSPSPAPARRDSRTTWAMGERQMLPRQTRAIAYVAGCRGAGRSVT